MNIQNPGDDLATCIMQADLPSNHPNTIYCNPDKGVAIPQPSTATMQASYALAKQIGSIHTISSNYGDLPLDEDDIDAVQHLLRKRFERKLKANHQIDNADKKEVAVTTYTCRKAITVPALRAQFEREGLTLKKWAADNGYDLQTVYKVVGGTRKAIYGRGHEIAVRLGIKVGTAEVSDKTPPKTA